MPPRYAYWTILIDGKATAFRAREREELLPTFNQLARKNADIVMRYFARGKLWDSPEQAEWANRNAQQERRGPDWRPGGAHKDPRARFDERREHKKKRPFGADRGHREGADRERREGTPPAITRPPNAQNERPRSFSKRPRPWQDRDKPGHGASAPKWNRPSGDGPERKWTKPAGDRPERKWNKPAGDRPERKWNKPTGDRPERKWNKPAGDQPERKWNKPAGDRPERKWNKPAEGEKQSDRPAGEASARKPWQTDRRPQGDGQRQSSDRPRWRRPEGPHPRGNRGNKPR